MNIDLSTDAPPSPERTLKLAGMLAEIVRTLNHQTRHHEALEFPSEADRLIRELSSAASRLPQLLGQIGAWLDRERVAGRIEVPAGEFAGDARLAAVTAGVRLEMASAIAAALQEALDDVARVTCNLAAPEDGSDA